MSTLKHIIMPARMQPPHIGHQTLFEKASKDAKLLTIVIYASDCLGPSNPFTGEERKTMIDKTMKKLKIQNYEIVLMPYFDDSQKKKRTQFILDLPSYNKFSKKNTAILSGTPIVRTIFENIGHPTLNPHEYVEDEKLGYPIPLSGSLFRGMIIDHRDTDGKLDEYWRNWAAEGTIKFAKKMGIDSFRERNIKYRDIDRKTNENLRYETRNEI